MSLPSTAPTALVFRSIDCQYDGTTAHASPRLKRNGHEPPKFMVTRADPGDTTVLPLREVSAS